MKKRKAIVQAFVEEYKDEFSMVENDIVIERAHAKATHKAKLMGICRVLGFAPRREIQ